MAIKVIDGHQFDVPRYVSRSGDGWQVRLNPTKYFSDSQYGGIHGSFAAAVAYRESILPHTAHDEVGRYKTTENEGKGEPTGTPGVYIKHLANGGVVAEVRTKGVPYKRFHPTDGQGIEGAIRQAAKYREEQIALLPAGTRFINWVFRR